MIKVSDLENIPRESSATDASAIARRADIEAYIDFQIIEHQRAGAVWPLCVKVTRAGYLLVDIAVVLEGYRAAGWDVRTDAGGKYMCKMAPLSLSAVLTRISK